MGWVLACVLIALLGLVYLGLQAREVWRKGTLLLGEVEAALERVDELSRPEGSASSATTSGPAAPSEGRPGT